MPMATEEQRAEWGGSDGIGEEKAWSFLEQRGWQEVGNGFMRPSKPVDQITDQEWDALSFLIDEWDFGYLPPGTTLPPGA